MFVAKRGGCLYLSVKESCLSTLFRIFFLPWRNQQRRKRTFCCGFMSHQNYPSSPKMCKRITMIGTARDKQIQVMKLRKKKSVFHVDQTRWKVTVVQPSTPMGLIYKKDSDSGLRQTLNENVRQTYKSVKISLRINQWMDGSLHLLMIILEKKNSAISLDRECCSAPQTATV